jgi:subtilisin family serine protease
MIIGQIAKPGFAARLTGKVSASPTDAATTVSAPTDEFTMSTSTNGVKTRLAGLKSEVSAQEEFLGQYEIVPDQVLVRLKGDEVGNLSDFATEYGSKILHQFDLTGLKPSKATSEPLMLLGLNGQMSVAEAMVLMGKDDRVSVVESNDIVRTQVTDKPATAEPNDLDGALWGLHNEGQDGGLAGIDIGAKKAWETSVGSRTGPIVAVVDTGVDYRHQDLKDNIFVNEGEIPGDGIDNDGNGVIDDINGYNAAADSTDPKDDNGHGTHVAGTIGAVGNNGKGVTGVNQEARILPVRFLAEDGAGSTADAIKGLVYASRTGARIVNNSWGGNKYNQLVFDVIADSEALFVCAAGNEAFDNDIRPVYPANFELDNVLSVTAHDRKNEFPKFANRGEKSVDLAAPGVDIQSTLPSNKYGLLSGTSMATPHVSGAAVLLASAVPGITNEEIKFRLINNLSELPEQYGSRIINGGRLDLGKALEKDTTPPAPVGDLKLESAGPEKMKVSWVATGDDGTEGRLSGYDVRYTLGHFKNGEGDSDKTGIPFSDARRLATDSPKKSGEKEQVEFELSPSGKPRHLTLGVVGLDNVINKGELRTLALEVPAAKVAFEDRGESAESAFAPSEHWSLVDEPGRGKVYTESPEGEYPPNRDAQLVSKTFSLEGFEKPILHFDSKIDVENKHDEFVVEIEKYGWFGRRSWEKVASFDGLTDWQSHKIDLGSYTGKDDMRIRFRLESDKDRNRDGVFLDNVVIAEAPKQS